MIISTRKLLPFFTYLISVTVRTVFKSSTFHQFEGWSEHCPKYQASRLIVPFFIKPDFQCKAPFSNFMYFNT